MSIHPATRHLIKLTTHPSNFGVDPEPLNWGERDPQKRGPVVATVSKNASEVSLASAETRSPPPPRATAAEPVPAR